MARRAQIYFAEGVDAVGLRLMTAADLRRVCEYIADHPECGIETDKHGVFEVTFEHPLCRVTYYLSSPNSTKLLIIDCERPQRGGQTARTFTARAMALVLELMRLFNRI